MAEEKLQEKMKMTDPKIKNFVNVQQQYGVSFCPKLSSYHDFSG